MKIELTNVQTNKLHEELMKAGIIPEEVESFEGTTWITVKDEEAEATMLIVAQHDNTPPILPKTEIETLRETVDTLILSML